MLWEYHLHAGIVGYMEICLAFHFVSVFAHSLSPSQDSWHAMRGFISRHLLKDMIHFKVLPRLCNFNLHSRLWTYMHDMMLGIFNRTYTCKHALLLSRVLEALHKKGPLSYGFGQWCHCYIWACMFWSWVKRTNIRGHAWKLLLENGISACLSRLGGKWEGVVRWIFTSTPMVPPRSSVMVPCRSSVLRILLTMRREFRSCAWKRLPSFQEDIDNSHWYGINT